MRWWLAILKDASERHRSGPILKLASGLAEAIRRKSAWSWMAGAVSLGIIAAASFTLVRLLRHIEFGAVVGALQGQSVHGLLAAALFVVAGYSVLTCYDLFALRAIGCDTVPYRVAAFAGFTSYTIGHNFGGTIFTSGLIRYRIYSAWGLRVADIARIAFLTGLTYCLGNAFVLGCGLTRSPGAASTLDHLPVFVNRLAGIAAIAALSGYLVWLSLGRRAVGRANWRIAFPPPRWTLLQIGIGSLDLVFVALAMYSLLPKQPAIDVLGLIVIFVTAMLIGVVSYVPGSLGVIEAAMFIGLPQFNREELLASLLTFRVMYFVVPLCVAAILLGVRECRAIVAAVGRVA